MRIQNPYPLEKKTFNIGLVINLTCFQQRYFNI